MGYPSIFPTGTLIYDKDKTFNGYTVFPSMTSLPTFSPPWAGVPFPIFYSPVLFSVHFSHESAGPLIYCHMQEVPI